MVTKRCVARVLGRAFSAERDGREVEALRLAEVVLNEYPLHPDARVLRARLWARSGKMDAAYGELTALTERNPEDIEARLALAAVHLLRAQYGVAIDHLSEVARACEEETTRTGSASDSGKYSGEAAGVGEEHHFLGLSLPAMGREPKRFVRRAIHPTRRMA